jgi:hypothetical protein
LIYISKQRFEPESFFNCKVIKALESVKSIKKETVSYLNKKSCSHDFRVVLVESDVQLGRVRGVGEVDVLQGVGEVFGTVDRQVDVRITIVAFQVVEKIPKPRLGYARVDIG